MRLVTCFGIHLRLHGLLLPTLALFAYGGRLGEALLLFIIVLGHEATHALVAWAYGLRPVEIELLPVGGVIRFHGVLEHRPVAEAIVAAAGPVYNIVLALGTSLWVQFVAAGTAGAYGFIRMNVVLACFNLLPALPFDGGRIVRAFLATKYGYGRATRAVVNMSRVMGWLLVGGGIVASLRGLTAFVIVFLGLIVRRHARHELQGIPFVLLSYLAGPNPVSHRGAVTSVVALAVNEHTTLGSLLPTIIPGKSHVFYVVGGDGPLAHIATEHRFRQLLFQEGIHAPASSLLRIDAVDDNSKN